VTAPPRVSGFQPKRKPAEPKLQPLPKVRMPLFLSTERPSLPVPVRIVTSEELARM
jgi:hypothetical protein